MTYCFLQEATRIPLKPFCPTGEDATISFIRKATHGPARVHFMASVPVVYLIR